MATMPAAAHQSPVNGIAAPAPSPTTGELPDISGRLMRISPQMARDLLKNRLPNRTISKSRIRQMIDDLRAGKWVPNGESIIVSADMQVLDGQHRLLACAESGIPLTAVVVCGVDPAAMPSIDQGQRRGGSDHLSMHDHTNTGTLSATVRWHWRLSHGQMHQKAVGLRDHELPAYVQARPGLPLSLSWGRRVRDMLPQSCASALYHLMSQKDAALAKTYFVALESGIDLAKDHPARIVRDRLLKDKTPRNHLGVVVRAATAVLGWNGLRAGEPYGTGFTWKGERDEAVRFPTIM